MNSEQTYFMTSLVKSVPVFCFILSMTSLMAQSNADKAKGSSEMKELLEMMKPYPEAYHEMKNASNNVKIARGSSFVGAFLVGIPIGSAIAGKEPNWTLATVGSGFVVAAIPFYVSFKKGSKRALNIYEYEIMKPFNTSTAHLKLGECGVGISLSF